MYIELACIDKGISQQDALNGAFAASELKLDGYSTLTTYIPHVKEYVSDMILSCPIDYPDGTADTKVRNHAILNAIRKGANTIDLVVQQTHLVNRKLDSLIQDISSNYDICEAHKVTLRIMFEYRATEAGMMYEMHGETITDISTIIREIGVEYVFPSTGHMLDNYADNLIAGRMIMGYSGLKVISNGNIYSKEQYDVVKQTGLYGLRLTSAKAARSIFGV